MLQYIVLGVATVAALGQLFNPEGAWLVKAFYLALAYSFFGSLYICYSTYIKKQPVKESTQLTVYAIASIVITFVSHFWLYRENGWWAPILFGQLVSMAGLFFYQWYQDVRMSKHKVLLIGVTLGVLVLKIMKWRMQG